MTLIEPVPTTQTRSFGAPPPRRRIEGPAAWTGADMRRREAQWTYRLSPAEIAEIEQATREVRARGLDIAEITRDDFPLPTLGATLDRLRGEVVEGRGFVRLRGMPVEPADRGERDRILGGRHTFRQGPLAERQGSPARPRLRPRAGGERGEPAYPQLRDRRTAEFPYRPLRPRRAAVSAAGEIRWAINAGQRDDPAQCHGRTPSRPAGAALPPDAGRSPRRSAGGEKGRSTRRRYLTSMPGAFPFFTRGCISARRSASRRHAA